MIMSILRAPFRAAHLALAEAAQQRGELLLGGAFSEPADGALLVFRAETPQPPRPAYPFPHVIYSPPPPLLYLTFSLPFLLPLPLAIFLSIPPLLVQWIQPLWSYLWGFFL